MKEPAEAFKRNDEWMALCDLCMKAFPTRLLTEASVPGRSVLVVCRTCSPRSFEPRPVTRKVVVS